VFDEGGDEVLTRLLAIADDIDPGVLLLLQRDLLLEINLS